MRILQILPELNVGGVETGTIDFARYLVKKSHTSIVVSNGGDIVDALLETGSRHYTLPVHKKSLFTICKMIKPLRKIIIEEKIDIVHARSRVPAWIAYFACRGTNAVFVTTCHGYYKSILFSRVMGWGKLVIVPSKVIARHMVETFGVAPENIRCIPRSVDIERFNVKRSDDKKDYYTISIVGRITPLKGHSYFLKAMAKLIQKIPYIKIWIIGDAPEQKKHYRSELEILVHRLGIEDKVEFLGKRKDIPTLLAKTDVLVLSTITQESFGRVILEAQAAGVPVVATKVGGVIDIIQHEKTGLLVEPKDIDSMAEQVYRLLNDKNLAKKIINTAKRQLKQRFSVEKMCEDTINVYKELLERQNILIIKMSSAGDIILSIPALQAIRERFPKARISCVTNVEYNKILKNCPYIDEVILFDKRKHHGYGLLEFCKNLRKNKFDKVIDLQNNKKSHIISFLSFSRQSYGYDNGKFSFLLSNKIKDIKKDVPPVQHQFMLLEMLGIKYDKKYRLKLWPSHKDTEYVLSLLDSEWLGNTDNIIGINLAASAKWESKNWPLEHIAKLCEMLAERNIRMIVTGTEKDKVRANMLVSITRSKPAIFIGKTDILQLAALIKHCKVYISPDSAPLHIAAAMGVACIGLFGPTSAKRHIPPAERISIIQKSLPCVPCYKGVCRKKIHYCMKKITPEEVLARIDEMIE